LSEKNISYETLLQKVTQKEIELDKTIEESKKIENDLRNQKGALEGILNLRINEELNKAKREIDRIINEARSTLAEARNNIHLKPKKIDEKSHQLKTELNKLNGPSQSPEPSQPLGNLSMNELKIGDLVLSLVLKKEFTVISMDTRKGEVTIGKGPIKLTVPLSTLSKSSRAKNSNPIKVSFERSSQSHVEYDVRGMRLSEFQNLIDKALGDLLSGDIPYLSIIHGHGDGILKNWLRNHLSKSRDFNIVQTDSGNDGETKVALK
jgi:DNA mismatch repair protein MutS2